MQAQGGGDYFLDCGMFVEGETYAFLAQLNMIAEEGICICICGVFLDQGKKSRRLPFQDEAKVAVTTFWRRSQPYGV